MPGNIKQPFSHILKSKQLVLASIISCLAAIFIFSLEDGGRAKAASHDSDEDEFVIKSHENLIQPVDRLEEEITPSEPVIYEKKEDAKAACDYGKLRPDFEQPSDLSPRKVRAPILMYHYIDAPGSSTLPWLYHPPSVFEAQLKTLADNCYEAVFVSDVAESIVGVGTLPSKSIAITFDDGYEDMYAGAYPLLRKYGMKGTMYIIVNALDKPGYLTRDQVREMSDSGIVEIAAHTMNHPDLRRKSWQAARYEISASKEELQKIIGKSVTDFAYPYGFFGSREETLCQEAGYQTCASTYPGQVQTSDKPYSLYRLRPGYRVGPALIKWLELAGPKK